MIYGRAMKTYDQAVKEAKKFEEPIERARFIEGYVAGFLRAKSAVYELSQKDVTYEEFLVILKELGS
jgi:hypothetical protein